jgi:hypothetical protein
MLLRDLYRMARELNWWLVRRHSETLVDAARLKFATNQSRRWGAPDTEGVVEHVEGEVQP